MATSFVREWDTEVRGHRTRITDWGGGGAPAVLCHATGFHRRVWDPIARELASDFRVVAFDARGHGAADPGEPPYPWDAFVADAIAVVESLGAGAVVGVGHSMGATSVAGAASDRPDLFSRVVLVDPICVPLPWQEGVAESPLSILARKRRNSWSSKAEALEGWRGKGIFAGWRDNALEAYVEHGLVDAAGGGVRLACPPEVEAATFQGAMGYDSWPRFAALSVPTLVLRGENSDAFPAEVAERLHDAVPGAGIESVPGTTHFLPMERPAEVARRIRDFARPSPREPRIERA